jgi:peptide/nickel transport system permease protein
LYTGLILLSVILLMVISAHWIVQFNPDTPIDPANNRYSKPSCRHWFGTDQFGRDVFSRVLFGGRITLLIAFSVVILSVLLGGVYGALSGYIGGILDHILMRIIDVFLSFPVIFLAITCMAIFGSDMFFLILVLALTGWMDIARMVRAEVISLKGQNFIVRARALGLKTTTIIGKHILPHLLFTVFAFSILRMADIILIESALSFIGLGVQPPTASWGSIINDGRQVLETAWWIVLFPGLAILISIISLNLIGQGIKNLKA